MCASLLMCTTTVDCRLLAVMVDERPYRRLVLDEAENIDESSSSDGCDDGSDDEETFSSANGAPDGQPSVERTLSSTSFAAYLGCLLWAETRQLRLASCANAQDTRDDSTWGET